MDALYRLAALDMDGTLLNTAKQITPYTLRVLARAARSGAVVALCTGRSISEIRPYLAELKDVGYAICVNGASVIDLRRMEPIRNSVIPDGEALELLRLSADYDAFYQIVSDNRSHHTCPADRLGRYHLADFAGLFGTCSVLIDDPAELVRRCPGTIHKINVFFRDAADRAQFRQRIAGRAVEVCDSVGLGIELSPSGASKARGLRELCAHLDIPVERSMAVGDGDNDLGVLRAAGLAVAMGNAIPEVRAVADAVTDDCDHDGAAKAIEKYMGV